MFSPLLRFLLCAVALLLPALPAFAHDGSHGNAELDAMIAAWRAQTGADGASPAVAAAPPAGYGPTMASSFGAFRPKVRAYWDATTFYVESDGLPDPARMPNLMVGITSWQQQIPVPVSYFGSTTNPERDAGSIGFAKPNVWRLPLVPVPSAAPIPISAGNFQRGAIAIGADGIPIFNPRNNTGRVSYEIGELDAYGGHCGLADDYHYHLAPVHLQAVVGAGQPVAWALDGYPIYGYTEPDGTARLPLDADGGHDHGVWRYHYHAVGSAAAGPQSPYLPTAFHGTVINYGGQVDGQPTVGSIRASGTGGYTARAVPGASVRAFRHPVALAADAAGHLAEDPAGTPSPDQYLMRIAIGNATYDLCWRLNRAANPKTMTVTWRLPDIPPTTTTYNSNNNRLTAYPMAGPSLARLPDTDQTVDATPVFGEDSDYTLNPPAYVDNGDGTITDRVTGLMWQKVDAGETTWDNAVARAGSVTTGGYGDWRLPTPTELFSLGNFNGNPAFNATYFPANPAGAAEYWWTSDIYGADATRVWCFNRGGGLGPKPKAETVSAGGTLRYHARYVRGGRPGNGHHYVNNLDGTVTDLDTRLMWSQVPAPAMTWSAALAFAEGLTLAGYSDWRLPNIKELQTLTDYTLTTATQAAAAQAPVNRVLFPVATTPATAYWSSTALRGGGGGAPTSAWLLEFGVNNAVPAAAGPPRGAQGIISYETMASSYPFFVVRTATLAEPPVIATQPAAFQTVAAGAAASLTVAATSATPVAYQWRRNGAAIPGATAATLSLPRVQTADAGVYSVTVTNAAGAVVSADARIVLGAARLANLSVRAGAGSGSETLIVGFVVGPGTAPRLLVRGIGPALGAFGVAGTLADPVLTLAGNSGNLAANDDWGAAANAGEIAATAAGAGAFALAPAARDAAVLLPLAPGAYTAQVTGKDAAGGVALVEAYEVSGSGAAALANLSARTRVGTGGEVLIAGFVVSGPEPKRLLVRAVGPGLAPFGVTGLLADPQLAIFRQGAATAIRTNDNWGSDPDAATVPALSTRAGAFALPVGSRDAACIAVLEPGAYTVQVAGAGATTGVALLELYDLP